MHLDVVTSAAVYTSHIINGASVYRHATTYRHICCCMATVPVPDYPVYMGMVLLGQPQTWVAFIRAFLLTSTDLKLTVWNRPV
jgi:hypothetical protein